MRRNHAEYSAKGGNVRRMQEQPQTTTKEEANMRKRIPRIAVDELGNLE